MTLPFPIESWIWYSVAVTIACLRLVSRAIQASGVLRLKVDDWMMVLAVMTHTAFLVTINKEVNYNSNLIQPGVDVASFSIADIHERVYGSKLTIVVEQMQCCTVWLLKGCLVILYYRVTYELRPFHPRLLIICSKGSKSNVLVRILAVYVGLSFLVMEVLYLGVWCQPFHLYWAVPTPNIQCSAAIRHLITNAVFNISSDLTLISIALSISIRNQLPTSRKIILSIVFGLGLFTVLSAALNKYYSFTHPFGSEWTYWYVRESSTAMIVSNLPFTWSLLRRIFNLKPFNTSRGSKQMAAAAAAAARTPTDGSPVSFRLKNISGMGFPISPAAVNRSRERGLLDTAGPDWRGAGLFGRQDMDAMAAGVWEDHQGASDDGLDGSTMTSQVGSAMSQLRLNEPQGVITRPESVLYHEEMIKDMPEAFALKYLDTATWMP